MDDFLDEVKKAASYARGNYTVGSDVLNFLSAMNHKLISYELFY